MSSYAGKIQENKSQSVASAVSQKQGGGESTFQFVDNRPEAVAQRKLQGVVNNSPQVNQLIAFQEMANNSPRAKQKSQLQAKRYDSTHHRYNASTCNESLLQRKVNYQDGVKRVTSSEFRQGTKFSVDGDHQNGIILQKIKLTISKLINNSKWTSEVENYWEGWLVENGAVKIPVQQFAGGMLFYVHQANDNVDHDSFSYDMSYADGEVTSARVEWKSVIYWVDSTEQADVLNSMREGAVSTAGGLLSSYQDPTNGVQKEYVGRRHVTSNNLFPKAQSDSESDSDED